VPPDPQPSADRPMYSIGAVARMLGVEPGTLRAWEERYRIVVPERSQGSQRVYSRAQVEQLRSVVRSMDEGATAADAHRLLAERLDEPPENGNARQNDRWLILVADRDRFFAELSEYVLGTAGYAVTVASSPAEAERLFAEQRPQLAVVELMRPHGVDLCRHLARDETPVVGVSALALRDQAMAAGASAFVQKPLEPRLLVSIVHDLLTSGLDARRYAAPVP
jgi:CheY-like chemotaxis protein